MKIRFPPCSEPVHAVDPFVVVWDQNRGEVKLLSGALSIALTPEMSEQLEKDLAAARRIPQDAAAIVAGKAAGAD